MRLLSSILVPVLAGVCACGGVDRTPGESGGGASGAAGGAGGRGMGGSGTAGAGQGGSSGGGVCSPPEGVTALVTPTGRALDGTCTVADIQPTASGKTIQLACGAGMTSLDLTAEPAIDVALAVDQTVTFHMDTEAIEGPEWWGSVRSATGELLLGFVSAGSMKYYQGDPWYAPLSIDEISCGEDGPRSAWRVTFDGSTTTIAEGQRRSVGPGGEYVAQVSTLHGLSTGVATTPSDNHIAVIARQP